jgi:hypothetical protein
VNPTWGASGGNVTRRPAPLRWLRSWPLLAALAVFLCSLAVALREALRWTGGHLIYAVDDAYIHMAVARTWATHSVWGCTPFHFSSSSSSLLWTFILGLADRAFGVHDWTPLLLNVAFAVGALVVADVSLSRLRVPPLLRASALVGIGVAFPLAAMVLLGMEHILHVLLTIGFAALAVEALANPAQSPRLVRRRTVALCVLGALLAASRYEGLFLAGLACLAFLVRRQARRAVSIGAAALLPVAAFGAVSVAKGWYFLPNPLMVKAVGENVSMLSALLKPFGSEDLNFLRNNRAMPILLGLGLLGVLAQVLTRRGFWRPPVLFPLALAAMILLHGHFVFSPLFWVYRYDAYLVAFGIFVAAVALAGIPSPRALPRGASAALLVALLVPLIADVREGVFPEAEIEGSRNTYLEEYQTAQFLRLYYPRDVVIVNDLGAVTYYTEARILDLVGLGDLEPLEIMRRSAYTSRDVVAWTAPYEPSIAILQLNWSVVQPLIPPGWIRVAVVEVPPHHHPVGFFAVDPKQIWTLRGSVAQHFGSLLEGFGYRVRLRNPRGLEAAAARLVSATEAQRAGPPRAAAATDPRGR